MCVMLVLGALFNWRGVEQGFNPQAHSVLLGQSKRCEDVASVRSLGHRCGLRHSLTFVGRYPHAACDLFRPSRLECFLVLALCFFFGQ